MTRIELKNMIKYLEEYKKGIRESHTGKIFKIWRISDINSILESAKDTLKNSLYDSYVENGKNKKGERKNG